PDGKIAIGTKWILKNKRDARGIAVRNKARLVTQGHRQEEGIDYDEVPSAWYARLSTFLLKHHYRRGTIDKTLFLKKDSRHIILVQVYMDDIIFSSTNKAWCDEFEVLMKGEFKMSAMGELTFFLGLQVKQLPDGIFISQDKHQVTPLTSHLNAVKKIFKYLKGQPNLGLWYPRDSPFQLEAYSDSDYAGSHGDRKSTTGRCQFLDRRLISWQCKKQTVVATSSTEAEYVAAARCYGQVLWIQNQMLDYGFNFMNIRIFIDNQSTIFIVKNPVFHQRTEHIEIRHHFIRDAYENNLIQCLVGCCFILFQMLAGIQSAGCTGFSCWFSTTPQMVFSSPWLTAKKELTHHEGTALWLVQGGTALGKDKSNPSTVGKDVSNPFMAVMVCQKPFGSFSSPMIHVPRAELVFNPPGMLLFHDPAVFGVPVDSFCWSPYSCWFLVAAAVGCCWCGLFLLLE
nr:putative ribonuclease H-like domain-containing protein [Tanacetum cinerariifolium]